MAKPVGFFEGNEAYRQAIEARITSLETTVSQQRQEIVRLEAILARFASVLQQQGIDEVAVKEVATRTLEDLAPPPTEAPTEREIEIATKLLSIAQRHVYAREFPQAREMYQRVAARYGHTEQAAVASQQLENLKDR